MNQQQIQQLFQLRYNQNNWKQFLSQAFSDARFHSTPDVLTGINTDVAGQVLRLGYVNLNENGIERNIAVYDVTLAPGIVLERNRVGLRNLLRKYWKDIDAAFIVYHRPENPNWRFTYVSELTGFDAEGELIKVKTEPKRYTYILGEGESCRTAAERFAIVAKKGNKTSLDDVKDAFSVEKLSKSFFDEYKKHYELFCNYMVSKPNIRQTIFNGDEKAIRDFNKKLLGRIVFLYFIQKKGWLGVPENSAWGQGDPDFLWNLFNNARNKGLFYSEYLTRLFFDTLNTPRPNDIIELKKGEPIKIPFLNGGLFEEDNKNYRNLIFPAELFENLFLFFNQYNFTIYEDDPNDHTVAVDPEMLGHIFENLLEDNKDKGAYYTPKEIVHYMCQESLIEYLCTTLQIEDEAKEKEAVTALLKQKEIDDILKPEIQNINDALDKVKICDPAIGSGAFPMGLLKEIFTAKQTLYTSENGNTEGFDASGVKLNIIQNSIYGVDIEKGAVDIARLRFWLSLVVDEEAPKALPNLDYKIVVGNSLVSKLGDDIIDIDWNLNETSHGLFGAELALQKAELLKKISKEQKEFFNPNSDKKKLAADIRKLKIDLLINQLELMIKTNGIETQPTGNGKAIENQTERYLETIGWKQQISKLKKLKLKPDEPLVFFDWQLDFPEIMNNLFIKKTGFDIVIANPPYLNVELIEPKLKEFLRKKFDTFYKRTDIFSVFLDFSMSKLLKKDGKLAFIIPSIVLNNLSYKLIRNKILLNNWLHTVFYTGNKIFSEVTVDTVILILDKTGNKEINLINGLDFFNPSKMAVPPDFFEKFGNIISVSGDSNSNDVFDKIFNSSNINIESHFDVFQGIVTGNNAVFIFDEPEQWEKSEIENELFHVVLHGRDFGKWIIKNTNRRIIYLGPKAEIKKFPKAKEYFLPFKSILSQRRECKNGAIFWYSLQWARDKSQLDIVPKIIIQNTRNERLKPRIVATVDEIGVYGSQGMNFVVPKTYEYSVYFLIGIINSKLIDYLFSTKFLNLAIKADYIKQLSFPKPSKQVQSEIEKLSKNILELKKKGKSTISIEKQIDNLVFKLYGLSLKEIQIIDPEFELSEQEYEAIKL